MLLLKSGKLEEAEVVLRETVNLYRKTYPPNHPEQIRSLLFLAETLLHRDKSNEAESVVRQATEISPSNSSYWLLLGGLYAYRGEWSAAVEPSSRAVELNPNDNATLFRRTIVLLQAGRQEEYRSLCHRYLAQAANNREFHNSDMAAKVSLLLPVNGADFERACQLTDFAETTVAKTELTERKLLVPWTHMVKALAQYRRERYTFAKDGDRAIATGEAFPECQAAAWFIRAAACAGLRQTALARTALDNGDTLVSNAKLTKNLVNWPDWAIADILRHEAAGLIEQHALTTQP